ncbi:hypothetical protein FJ364_04070 [Candidatus Dependentiae bacterium]|nr:hypothetical protein [Candidatus Dependentiae bacterium]
MVTSTYLPPSSLLIAYWMGGSFLMAVKRYAEIRLIKNKEIAVLYRKSFQYYTEEKLLISILFYAISFAFFFGIFLIKYKTELLLSFPFLAVMFAWYLSIGMQENSAAQRPEELYNEKKFSVYVCAVFILIIFLLFTNILWLQSFSNNILVTYPR